MSRPREVPRGGRSPANLLQQLGSGGPGSIVYDPGMRVEVNADLCQGHNRCYALAPELFDVDDYGTAVVIGDGEVSSDLEDKANLAVANCPEYAITIVDS
jgi:ferredoxin